MTRFRLSHPARADIANILATSGIRWGSEGRRRYAALLTAAMRQASTAPKGPATRDRTNLLAGVRSLHLRNVRVDTPEASPRQPVHVLYFRPIRSGVIEIVRVLHERMEPSRHVGAGSEGED